MQVDPRNSKLKPPGTQPLKLKCDIPLSTSAFKFDLRRYLKAKMGTESGQFLVGHLKYDGKASRKGGKGGNGDGKKEIGHLMRPLVGDEIDFTCVVDTNVKLPMYARGKATIQKKKSSNKRKNSLARAGESHAERPRSHASKSL